jgi:hypothetical protein
MRGITIAEQAGPAREYHQATHKYNPQPTWQSSCNNCDNDSCESCAYRDSLQFFSLHRFFQAFPFEVADPTPLARTILLDECTLISRHGFDKSQIDPLGFDQEHGFLTVRDLALIGE